MKLYTVSFERTETATVTFAAEDDEQAADICNENWDDWLEYGNETDDERVDRVEYSRDEWDYNESPQELVL